MMQSAGSLESRFKMKGVKIMWTRKELKDKAKNALKMNYWKTVLIAILLSLAIGSGGFGGGAGGGMASGISGFTTGFSNAQQNAEEQAEDIASSMEGIGEEEAAALFDDANIEVSQEINPIAIIAIVLIVLSVVLFIMAIVITLDILILNPLEIGCARFSMVNLNRSANVGEAGFGFDNCYKNILKIMFFRNLYIFLWSLLFMIPGIIKSYEYRMIPYLLADNPSMSMEEAFAVSREMMKGQKWRAFILDLSFIGWDILSLFTAGILNLFYVQPYKMMTNAALYEALAYGTPAAPEAQTYENS